VRFALHLGKFRRGVLSSGARFLAIRGISDVVDFNRDPDWTAYACETAAAFAQAFLLTRPTEPIRL
jgi:hypothetical protein